VSCYEAPVADPRRCSFCEKVEGEVAMLVDGKRASICDECIVFCSDVLREERTAAAKRDAANRRPTDDDDDDGPISAVRSSEAPPRNE
jgi:Fe-S-cluster-containing dehydrogenase component